MRLYDVLSTVSYPDPNVRNDDINTYMDHRYVHLGLGTRPDGYLGRAGGGVCVLENMASGRAEVRESGCKCVRVGRCEV